MSPWTWQLQEELSCFAILRPQQHISDILRYFSPLEAPLEEKLNEKGVDDESGLRRLLSDNEEEEEEGEEAEMDTLTPALDAEVAKDKDEEKGGKGNIVILPFLTGWLN